MTSPPISPAPVRVVICDVSAAFGNAMGRLLERGSRCRVVGRFERVEAAVAAMEQLRPDLVVMDLDLPGMAGLEAVERLMADHPVPILVVSSAPERVVAGALAAGALDVRAKQAIDLDDVDGEGAAALREHVVRLATARVVPHPRARLRRATTVPEVATGDVAAVGICASTGGPLALMRMLEQLPVDYALPVLVVQHMAPGFTPGFAQRLDAHVPLAVRVAAHGERIAAPGVWLAPEGAHLLAPVDGRVVLDRRTVHGYHRPSADVLFRSLAQRFGCRVAAVVLTGMGSDGALGIAAVRAAGGLTFAQDEATCAIFGMPRAAIEHGAEHVLAPERIASALVSLAPAASAGASRDQRRGRRA